jgi:hypothetical protein
MVVKRVLFEARCLGHDAAGGIDDRADSTVGAAHEEPVVLRCPKLREREMLPRFGGVAEPRVVREIDHQVGIGISDRVVREAR